MTHWVRLRFPGFRRGRMTHSYAMVHYWQWCCIWGIVILINSLWSTGCACIYGARIWACLVRLMRNASLAQQPLIFMTSKGTPRSRYSSVVPMHMPCPWHGSRLAAWAVLARALMNAVLVSVRGPAIGPTLGTLSFHLKHLFLRPRLRRVSISFIPPPSS